MESLKMQTPNRTQNNIERIAQLFPNVITESHDENGKIKKVVDFDLLRQQLSEVLVEDDNERYRLDWPGKKASLLKANMPIKKTLRPCREESVNFDTTENLYIEGDNFEVLKILQESYLGKIKMIYIDPPYNTGNDFIYKDDFKKSKEEYEEEIGVEDEEGGKLFRNTDSNGRFHSDWLSMMYERLLVARDLLRDDGVIFISIDDNEVHNLRKICDEIFGEENFLSNLIWKKKYIGGKHAKHFVDFHEYVLVYSKRVEVCNEFLIDRPDIEKGKFELTDEYLNVRGRFYIRPLKSNLGLRETLIYPIICPDGTAIKTQWMVAEPTFHELVKDGRIVFKMNREGVYNVYRKYYEYDGDGKVKVPSLIDDVANANGKVEIKELFEVKEGRDIPFENPKPVGLLRYLIAPTLCSGEIILDFFSGSATTAHATMQLNAEDGGNRKFIMVQLPEQTDESSVAYKAGYKTIAEIGKERIRRAGKKILQELKEKSQQTKLGEEATDPDKLDIGFRVYKTDTTNMKDVFYHPTVLQQTTLDSLTSNIKEDRTPEDLLTQVLLDLGLELSLPIEQKKIRGNTVFIVQTNALVACFDDNIDFKIIDEIADLQPMKVVFKDASFKDDKDRINVEERFKRLSLETQITVL